MLLIIDNYDSFTYNLYQYFCELGAEVVVVRNDEIDIAAIEALAPTHLVISPGPCTPNEAGISLQAIEYFAGKLPILGVCLGHQSLAQVFGGDVVRARQVMHGKTSPIWHTDIGVFKGLNNPLTVTRYHSLVVKTATLPDCFEITAWTELNGEFDEIMGIRHKSLDLEGVQFHPESILTEQGHALLANFLQR
ncbi:aminodeoxychorismate/anthranilate synthase component II [Photobacterium phosphoreum]|jgi:para-aminobenzoate synthetase component 2|uniref:Aminodeoxychorismate/anthranilate synthase component II n=1 Tax=Photobacterium phosphoreum TaxID=659 RepID=A0AAW4ZMV0_PHOPO|nr:aminodeoxychorismate/anthranilate synthase component II [Photobacterium phosphoreum]KJF87077.1 anthranilate synthase component II [Photobacterium phosphoreum]MCD9463459.1 aminodeoxychorismate/anthranilate synthase component II [Photobacterium phosphoreum]MCD9471488.1 aminodeoxychorismate/anthranilate synthase component II [Photobacterium phosphoreum]MCD9476047.1 aminodeoxychorismate/anthranilate synthase component II [Photobacterium phosphoreum]MCD9479798.1 aminodeoxychorismate/anthranilate